MALIQGSSGRRAHAELWLRIWSTCAEVRAAASQRMVRYRSCSTSGQFMTIQRIGKLVRARVFASTKRYDQVVPRYSDRRCDRGRLDGHRYRHRVCTARVPRHGRDLLPAAIRQGTGRRQRDRRSLRLADPRSTSNRRQAAHRRDQPPLLFINDLDVTNSRSNRVGHLRTLRDRRPGLRPKRCAGVNARRTPLPQSRP